MGRPEVDNPPPSPSPMDRSSTSENYYTNEGGRRGPFSDPEAGAKSRKKWIALGLCMCLILVLLIAVIVLATSKDTPPPCPNAKNNSDAAPFGSNDHLKSNENLDPSIGESRMEGIDKKTSKTDADKLQQLTETLAKEDEVNKIIEKHEKSIETSTMEDVSNETFEQPLEGTVTEQPSKDSNENIEDDIDEKVLNETETTSESNSSFDRIYDEDDLEKELDDLGVADFEPEQNNILEVFDDSEVLNPRRLPPSEDELDQEDEIWDSKNLVTPDDGSAEYDAPEDKRNMMSDLGKFWNEIEGLPKEERSKRIQEEYGGNPEILEILKEILANKDDHHDNLKNVLDNWRQAASEGGIYWETKEILTPDDRSSNARHVQASSGLLEAFLESFQDPAVGEAPNVTISDFYKMVQALTDVMQEILSEKDAPDSIEETVLSFLNGLASDIKLLNKNEYEMNIQEFLKPNQIEKVQRLWDDYVNNVYAKVQQSLKEEGLEPLGKPLTHKEKDEMRKQISKKNFESFETIHEILKELPTGRDLILPTNFSVKCDPLTEMPCDDGKGCYAMNKKCDRYIDCVFDRSDEKDCPCKRYLDPSRICDGYPDCISGEDEIGCVCQPWEHSCGAQGASGIGTESQCIDIGLRCDNVIDCKNSNDEMNCLALRNTVVPSQKFPRQEVQGLLHIQKSSDWYVFAMDISSPSDQDKYTDLVHDLAREVCYSTISPSSSPEVEFVDLDDAHMDVAHLQANFDPSPFLTRFYDQVGRFDFSIKPAFNGTTKGVRVNCGQPKCGQSVNYGSDPFAVLRESHTYQGTEFDRIVGGKDARSTKFPFVLSLHRNGYFKCGASIIHPQWILTAAHCVYNFTSREDYFEVRGGIYRQKSLGFSETVRKLDTIYIHPMYDDRNILHDIAIAKVDRPFDMDSFTATVCMPPKVDRKEDIENIPKPGDECLAVGWGILDADEPVVADTLQEVEVPVIRNCTKQYSNSSMYVCGGFSEGGKDSCQGDSGGPLFCRDMDKSEETWYLAGIISHGKGCALANSASYYSRVAQYQDWIDEMMNGYVEGRIQKEANTKKDSCPSGVSCDSGRCVPELEICDWRNDCFDGLDEKHCTPSVDNGHVKLTFNPGSYGPISTTTEISRQGHSYNPNSLYEMKPQHLDCSPGSFICNNVRQCISSSLRCDMKHDCIDGTDENDCNCRDYFEAKSPDQVCDGYPDCYDFSDELGCPRCKGSSEDAFFCHLSNKCIPRNQVCDEKYDCHFQEDERYCMALTKNDYLGLGIDGKPDPNHHGYAAVNFKGNWRFICTQNWSHATSNRICKYLGYLSSNNHELVPNYVYPHLAIGYLPQEYREHNIYKRSANNSQVIIGRNSECKYVDLDCKPKRTCGQLPLYSSMGKETPTFGEGATPWTAGIYREGVYTCGATLVNPRWLLTHRSCAEASMPQEHGQPQKYTVARLGAYLDNPDLKFLAGHEQVIRIARSLIIPESDIALLKLEKEANLTEYVHTICLPNTEWVPINTKCFIHGRHAGVFNHAIETTTIGKCNEAGGNFDICAKQNIASGECLDNWSGTLVCPDLNGNLYAVGIYHSGPNSDCAAGGLENSGSNIPEEFVSIVSNTAREAIVSLVSANAAQDELMDDSCSREQGNFRCPLGTCLNSSQVCDGTPQCENASDEKSEFCTDKIRMCEQVNATHCECLLDDMMCDNLMCLNKDKFCDGHNDCGDGSDEPENCENDCSIALAAYAPDRICDAKLDCIGEHDMGNDESVERCCEPENSYRCALGHYPGNVSISNECIPRKCVCDWDVKRDECDSCLNGADENDCMSIYGHKKRFGYREASDPTEETEPKIPSLDAFGRSKTQAEGYVYFNAHGKDYLYCASTEIFTQERRWAIGEALCKHENFTGVRDIAYINPFSRTLVNPNYVLPTEEQGEFNSCQIIYLSCISSALY